MIYDILRQRRDIILKKWGEETLSNYASGHFKSLRNKKDRFGNPVVYSISTGLEIILDELTARTHTSKLDDALEDIVKIRSLQTEKPSDSVEFLLVLKKILRHEWGNSRMEDDLSGDIEVLNSQIDDLILLAFDIYMKCREKLYEIKSQEFMRRSYRLLERANLLAPSLQNEGDDDDTIS